MKVAHITAIDFTLAVFMKVQLLGLRDAGYEVHSISSPGPLLAELRAEGITCHETPISRSADPRGIVRAARAIGAIFERERFDVVHTHTPIASISSRIAAKRHKIPKVFYTAHGFYFHEHMNPVAYRAHVLLEKGLGRWTDHLFVQSREDLETAVREGISTAEATTYLGNGVDAARFTRTLSPVERSDKRATLGIAPGDFVFAYAGRLVQEKGIAELISAVASAVASGAPLKVLLIGSNVHGDRDHFQSQMHERIRAHGLMHSFIFAGFTRDVPHYLELADAFVLPSYREGMPRSIIEAMHMELPVVATDIRGPREEVRHGDTGYLVPPRAAKPLTNAFLRLAEDRPHAAAMGRAGRQRALREFCESQVMERLLNGYEKALSPRAHPCAETTMR